MKKVLLLILLLSGFFYQTINAAYLRFVPQTVFQPDSTRVDCYASGDEFYNWLHDEDGYTIIQASDGWFCYAKKSGDKIISSGIKVNHADPAGSGIQPWLIISYDDYITRRHNYSQNVLKSVEMLPTGTVNNIVVFIRFIDEPEFTDNLSLYSDMFNNSGTGYNSMKNYFTEASYDQLTINTAFYPATTGTVVVSFQDTFPRDYYRPYNETTNPYGYADENERRIREHSLLVSAINSIGPQVPSSLNIDSDNDGNVDNVCFVVSGSPDGWSELLWPHKWSLYTYYIYINSKRVYTYNLQLQTHLQSSGVGVLCHEMFHTIGAPDLYHYNAAFGEVAPASYWDLMEWNQNPPQHMTAYMKYRYAGWLASLPVISGPGTYTLNPLNTSSGTGVAYKIPSPNSSTEYFVVEYRKETGTFETSLPGSGLIIYRINTDFDGMGNSDYDGSSVLDELYVYRPGGSLNVNGSPEYANFSSDVGRTTFNSVTDPWCFLSQGSNGLLNISNITSAGSTISFTLNQNTLPLVSTGTATEVTSSSATLHGIVNANSSSTTIYFEYGTTTSYGSTISATPGSATGNQNVSVAASINNLSANTTYNFRLVAYNQYGYTYGSNMTFTTLCGPYTLPFMQDFESGFVPQCWTVVNPDNYYTWEEATNIPGNTPGTTSAFINCYFNENIGQTDELISPPVLLNANNTLSFKVAYKTYPGFADTLKVFISTDGGATFLSTPIYIKGGDILATGNSQTSYFIPSTSSDWRLETVALNAYNGNTVVFKFVCVNGYSNSLYIDDISLSVGSTSWAATGNATGVTLWSALLNGIVYPGGLTTTAYFEYGTSISYGSSFTVTPTVAGTLQYANVSALITNLSANTTYHYRIKAINGSGTFLGSDMTFTTSTSFSGCLINLPYYQTFNQVGIPECWGVTDSWTGLDDIWSTVTTANAGGTAYELRAKWKNVSGTSRIVLPPINTLGITSFLLKFRQFYDDYGTGATIKIQTSANGSTWTDAGWSFNSGSGNIVSQEKVLVVNAATGGTTYFAFVVTGNLFQFDYWYIDNISLQTIPNRMSLAEDFMNVGFTNGGDELLNSLVLDSANLNKVALIQYHMSWPQSDTMYLANSADNNARKVFYSISSIPHLKFNGISPTTPQYTGFPGNLTQAMIDSVYSLQAPFIIGLNHTISSGLDSIIVNMQITAVNAVAYQTTARIAVVEENINFPTPPGNSGATDFPFVMKKMLPDANGTPLMSFSAGQTVSLQFTWPLSSVYNINKIGVVAFVQRNSDLAVLHTAKSNAYVAVGNFDVSISQVNGAAYPMCDSNSFTPSVVILNNCNITISGCTINYQVDNGTVQQLPWYGSLNYLETDTVFLDNITAAEGFHTLTVFTSFPNGMPDVNAANDQKILDFWIAISANIPPVCEGFEGQVWPPAGMGVVNDNNGTTWTKALTGLNSGNSAFYNFYSNTSTGDIDDLLLSPVQLDNDTGNYQINFDVAYCPYTGFTDELQVQVSDDCGNNWTTVYSKTSPTLATVPPSTSSFFPSNSQWRSESADISQFAGQQKLFIRFRAINGYGNNLYVDNICVTEIDTIRMSLVEHFCNVGFTNSGEPSLDTLLNNPYNIGKVVPVYYHVSWPQSDPMNLNNPDDVTSRIIYYDLNSIPKTYFNGTLTTGGNYDGFPGNLTQSDIDSVYQTNSLFSIDLNHELSVYMDSIKITMAVTALANVSYQAVVRVAVVETEVNFSTSPGSTSQTHFPFVMKKLLPEANGNAMQVFTQGQTQCFDFAWPLSNIYSAANIGVVAFIQNDSTHEVLQSAFSNPLPFDYDAAIIALSGLPADIQCDNSPFTPVISLKNEGTVTMDSCIINYKIDNDPLSQFTWTGSLSLNQSTNVTIPQITPSEGSHTFTVFCSLPNGQPDFITSNDQMQDDFQIALYGASIPITEGFEGADWPPADWQIGNPNNSITWEKATTGNNSSGSAYIRLYNNSSYGDLDNMIMLPLDMSNQGIFYNLTFDVAYTSYPGYSDGLRVEVSNDCGATWSALYEKYGSDLATAPETTSFFIPGTDDWRTDSVNISEYAGDSLVFIRFVSISGYGNNIYIDNINISQSQIFASIQGSDVSCFSGNDGSADLNVTIGNGPFSFNWSNGYTTEDISALTAGTYWVTISDNTGSSVEYSVVISEPSPIVILQSITDATCSVCNNGSIFLTVTGGSFPYSYNWSDSSTSDALINTLPGNYFVTVNDAENCEVIASYDVNFSETQSFYFEYSSFDSCVCNSGYTWFDIGLSIDNEFQSPYLPFQIINTIQVDINSACGEGGYFDFYLNGLYLGSVLNTAQSCYCSDCYQTIFSEVFTLGVPGMNYSGQNTLSIYSSTSVAISNITVTLSNTPLPVNAAVNGNLCFGDANGSIDLGINPGFGPFNYNWSNGSTTEDISGLVAGTYSVTLTDLAGSTLVLSYVVTEPPDFDVNYSIYSAGCQGCSYGSIELTVSGGNSPYYYLWSNGGTGADLYNLSAGIYYCSITDAAGCIKYEFFPVTGHKKVYAYAAYSTNSSYLPVGPLSFYLNNPGSITSLDDQSAIGYISSGTWINNNWYGIDNSTNSLITVDIVTGARTTIGITGYNIDGLAYDYTTSKLFGLSWYGDLYFINIQTGSASFIGNSGINGMNCLAADNAGTLFAVNTNTDELGTIDKNTGVWSSVGYIGFDAAYAQDMEYDPESNMLFYTSYDYSYGGSLRVIDPVSASTFIIGDFYPDCEITGFAIPGEPLIEAIIQNNQCNGNPQGYIEITLNYMMLPCTFNWSNGATTQNIYNLPAGDYSVTVTDANSRTAYYFATITQPSELTVESETIPGDICSYAASVNLTIGGGTPEIISSLNADTLNLGNFFLSGGQDSLITVLSGNIQITGFRIEFDFGGSTANPSGLEWASEFALTLAFNGTDCITYGGYNDLCNGTGTTNWSFYGASAAGFYSDSVILAQPITLNNILNIVVANGWVDAWTVSYSNVKLILYSYSTGYTCIWNDGYNGKDRTGLTAGSYTITITDSGGCQAIQNVSINLPSPLACNISTGLNSLQVTASGGYEPYLYSWSNGDTGQNILISSGGLYEVTVTDNNNCLSVCTIQASVSGPGWEYNITGANHSIIIPSNASLLINGNPVSAGDYVGVFFDSLGTLKCGGYLIWQGNSGALSAWGTDLGYDGFAGGEMFKWKVWDASENNTYNAVATYLPGFPNTAYFVPNGMSGVATLNSSSVQNIILPQGWGIFSTYIDPFNPDISEVFNQIVSEVTIIKTGEGDIYWPVWSVNNIGDMLIGKGYQIKMVSTQTLSVTGLLMLPEYTPVNVPSGWGMIGYLRQVPASVEIMMSPIVANITIVKDGAGDIYWPFFSVNTLGNMNPGEGYQIKTIASCILIYPPNSQNFNKSESFIIRPEYFGRPVNTGNNMTLGISTDNFGLTVDHDLSVVKSRIMNCEIGVFDSEGLLVGSAVSGGKFAAITLWGDDELTPEKDGLLSGEPFFIRLFRGNNTGPEDFENPLIYSLVVTSWLEGDQFYEPNKISIAGNSEFKNMVGLQPLLYQNVPNPFKQFTEISIYLPDETFAELNVYNSIGIKIMTLCSKIMKSGKHSFRVDYSGLSTGSYFYRLTAPGYSCTKSMEIQ